uniref:T-box domain-containing protein n=1 Tax=Anopheles maculatus TaxID=74869 RepID=A0A182SIF3_9DIPT
MIYCAIVTPRHKCSVVRTLSRFLVAQANEKFSIAIAPSGDAQMKPASSCKEMLIKSPLSVDRFPEADDDIDVDVEQCSDSEVAACSNRTTSKNRTSKSRTGTTSPARTTGSPSDEERLTPEPAQSKSTIVGSCNCDELRPVQCHLETKELWDKFHDLGTEMIITKTGR